MVSGRGVSSDFREPTFGDEGGWVVEIAGREVDAERLDVDVDVSWEAVPRYCAATWRSEAVETPGSSGDYIVSDGYSDRRTLCTQKNAVLLTPACKVSTPHLVQH